MILVTGANGQVGQSIRAVAHRFPSLSLLFMSSAELDITRAAAIRKVLEAYPVQYCINCAAYTAVDKAESDVLAARKVNVLGPQRLAEACAERSIPLLHLSTDYVYHSRHNLPLVETDATSPRSVYARTKLAGEKAALKAWPQTMIIRTSWVYSEFGNNFVKTMLRLGRERDSLRVVFDQIGTPTYAPDLAEALLLLLERVEQGALPAEALAGIWHYSNEGVTSWYDFAKAVFDISNIPCKVSPIESREYPTPAARPPFSVLNKGKIKNLLQQDIPYWRDSLVLCLQNLAQNT